MTTRTGFEQPEPPKDPNKILILGKIHRNCGYCGRTYWHTIDEHQVHIHTCESERLLQAYGPAPKKKEDKP